MTGTADNMGVQKHPKPCAYNDTPLPHICRACVISLSRSWKHFTGEFISLVHAAPPPPKSEGCDSESCWFNRSRDWTMWWGSLQDIEVWSKGHSNLMCAANFNGSYSERGRSSGLALHHSQMLWSALLDCMRVYMLYICVWHSRERAKELIRLHWTAID